MFIYIYRESEGFIGLCTIQGDIGFGTQNQKESRWTQMDNDLQTAFSHRCPGFRFKGSLAGC